MKGMFKDYSFFLFVLFSAVVLASIIRWLFYGTTVWEIIMVMGLLAFLVWIIFRVFYFLKAVPSGLSLIEGRHHSQC